jgi:hypothetical protein
VGAVQPSPAQAKLLFPELFATQKGWEFIWSLVAQHADNEGLGERCRRSTEARKPASTLSSGRADTACKGSSEKCWQTGC